MRLNINLTDNQNIDKNLFFTSDFHLFHQNVLKFDQRPFTTLGEMHIALEENWNSVVGKDDIVIYVGDLTFARREDIGEVNALVKRLNGKIHYVLGNHDKISDIQKMNAFESVQDYLELRLTHFNDDDKVKIESLFCIMHYPIYSWNKKHHGSYHIHGHSHHALDNDEFHQLNRIIDVGCNGCSYTPISYKKIIDKLNLIDFKIANNHH